MQVSKPSMTAVERAAQEATTRYSRFHGHSLGFDTSHDERLAARKVELHAPRYQGVAHKMTLDDINQEHVRAAFGPLDPELAAPLATIDQLLADARVKLPTKLVVHTSHLDRQSAARVERALSPFQSPNFMCANGHALGSGTDWCHRCDEADQDRRRLPTAPADTEDNETRMFDERERARQTEDDFGPREIHEMMQETHVIVGDHPPERRRQW